MTKLRRIGDRVGIAAIALPRSTDGKPDFNAMLTLLGQIESAGLHAAGPVDTTNKLRNSDELNAQINREIDRASTADLYIAGVTALHEPQQPLNKDAIFRDCECIGEQAVPMLMTNHGFVTSVAAGGADYIEVHHQVGQRFGEYLIHILSTKFTPAGVVPPLEVIEEILVDPNCLGFKTSSWDLEYDATLFALGQKYDKKICATGHDDEYLQQLPDGFDFLLGASTFAPEQYGQLLRCLENGDMDGYCKLGNVLQRFARFVFREPTPGYVHNLHQWLWLLGQAECPDTHPDAQRRPEDDLDTLREFAAELECEVVN